MSDWRSIRAHDVDWTASPISRRAGYKVRMMCSPIYLSPSGKPWSDTGCGAWHDLTLGQIADLGERHWLRCANIGDLGVRVIKWGIDAAAEGRCPMLPASGAPAVDAYIPQAERKEGEDE